MFPSHTAQADKINNTPRYIGFRLNLYIPSLTSRVELFGFLGLNVVSALRKETTADMFIASPTISNIKDSEPVTFESIEARLAILDTPHIHTESIKAINGGGILSSI